MIDYLKLSPTEAINLFLKDAVNPQVFIHKELLHLVSRQTSLWLYFDHEISQPQALCNKVESNY